ncbi:MAG: 4Fe-4S binding protein [Treponema sp.]|nr:4Fe-4S binding protein [Treponema sp.]
MVLLYVLIVLIILILSALILILVNKPFATENEFELTTNKVVAEEELNYIKSESQPIKVSDKKAFVMCSCKKNFKISRTVFNKAHTCFMINSDNGTGTDCKFSCIGLGDCVKICPQNAIKIVNNSAVITSTCVGCGKCVDICPLGIIKLIPKDTPSIISCSNCDNSPTSCSDIQKEQAVVWEEKNDFKFWKQWYKLFKRVIKN